MNNNISVIIPFYNSSATLPKILDSILSGTVVPSEIILVNDGSTDSSKELALAYSDKHPFIKVISQANSGVSSARNKGLSEAHGYWISFLDADDYIEPDMYSQMLHSLETAPGEVNGCICGYFTENTGISTPYIPGSESQLASKDLLKAMFTDEAIKGFLFTRLFRADLIKEMSFDSSIKMCEDLLFQTRLFSSREVTFTTVNKPLYHYVQNEQSATATKSFFNHNNIFVYKPAFDEIMKYDKNSYVSKGYNDILEYSMYTLLKNYRQSKSKDIYREVKLLQKEMKRQNLPANIKSKRRLAYELCPVLFSYALQ